MKYLLLLTFLTGCSITFDVPALHPKGLKPEEAAQISDAINKQQEQIKVLAQELTKIKGK